MTSLTFNPLSNIAHGEIKDCVAYIAGALITIHGPDPHWSESAFELVEGLLALLLEDPKREASLPNFRSILTEPYGELAKIAMETEEMPEDSIARRKLARFADPDLGEKKELCSIISTAITQTAFLDDPDLSKFLTSTTPGFSLDCLTEEGDGATIYLILPFDKLKSHSRWLRLMLSLAIRTVFRSSNKRKDHVLFLLDEFGNIGPLPAISSALSMGAGRNILLWIFVQSLVQLKHDYQDEWELFIANSDHMQFFDIMAEFTADYVSKLLGPKTISFAHNQHYSRDLLQASEIRRLSNKYGILINCGEKPVLYEKITYYNDPLFAGLARKDPKYSE